MTRIIAPRFELVLETGADGWYIAADLLRRTLKPVRVEGPYSLDYAMLRMKTLIPRDIAEALLTIARQALESEQARPTHHPTKPTR
jgi:hypothetical protein